MEHSLTLENRETLTVTAVTDVRNFDDESVNIIIEEGGLDVKGRNLKLVQLDLEDGQVIISGRIDNLAYTNRRLGSGGFFSRIRESFFGRKST